MVVALECIHRGRQHIISNSSSIISRNNRLKIPSLTVGDISSCALSLSSLLLNTESECDLMIAEEILYNAISFLAGQFVCENEARVECVLRYALQYKLARQVSVALLFRTRI